MRRFFLPLAVCACYAAFLVAAQTGWAQQATPPVDNKAVTAPDKGADKPVDPSATDAKPADPSAADTESGGDVSVGEVPDVQTEELTADIAKKAVDGYVMVHEKYQDSPLEDYQDLQEFVDKDPKGKEFETDIKGYGFNTVNEWNLAVTSLSIAYNNVLDDQTADIKQQIEDLQKSTDMAQDMKDRNIKSLQATIPSENNTKIAQDLIKDPVYGEKIKLLETTEE
jgi:hypothetical protein